MLPQMMGNNGPNNNQGPQNLRLNQGTNAAANQGQPNLFGNNNSNYNTNGNQLTGYHNAPLNNQLTSFPPQNGPQTPLQMPSAQQAAQYGSNVLNSLSASLAATGQTNLSLSQANSPRRESGSFDRRQQDQANMNMFGNTGLFSSNGMDYSRHLGSTKNSYYGILPGAQSQTPPPNQQFNTNANPLSNVIGLTNPQANGNSAATANGSNRIISAAPGKYLYFIINKLYIY